MNPRRPIRRRTAWGALLLSPGALAVACTAVACTMDWDPFDSRLPCADPTNCGAPNCDGSPKAHCGVWSRRWGDTAASPNPSAARGLSLGDGGVVLVGYAQGTIDLGLGVPQTFDFPGLVVTWVDADAGEALWAVAGTGNAEVYGNAVAVGAQGEIYVLGHTTDTFTLAPWGTTVDGLAVDGGGDDGASAPGVFVARVSPDGTPEAPLLLNANLVKDDTDPAAALAFAGTRLYAAAGGDLWWWPDTTDLALSKRELALKDKAILTAPSFHALVPIDGGVIVGGIDHPDGGPEAGAGFIGAGMLSDDGGAVFTKVQLATAANAGSLSKVQAVAVASCPDGTGPYVFAAGQLNDLTTFPPLPPISPPVPGVSEVFLARFEMDLTPDWVRHGAAVVQDGGQSYRSLNGPTLLAVDPQQGVLLGFSFRGQIDFDQGGTIAAFADNADQDLGLVSFTCDGAFQWALRFGQDNVCLSCMSPTSVPNLMNGLSVNAGGIYLAGTADTAIDFGSGVLDPVGAADLVLTRLAPR